MALPWQQCSRIVDARGSGSNNPLLKILQKSSIIFLLLIFEFCIMAAQSRGDESREEKVFQWNDRVSVKALYYLFCENGRYGSSFPLWLPWFSRVPYQPLVLRA
jgi:hypothetical protein